MGNLCVSLFVTVLDISKSIFIGAISDQEKQHIVSTFQYVFCYPLTPGRMRLDYSSPSLICVSSLRWKTHLRSASGSIFPVVPTSSKPASRQYSLSLSFPLPSSLRCVSLSCVVFVCSAVSCSTLLSHSSGCVSTCSPSSTTSPDTPRWTSSSSPTFFISPYFISLEHHVLLPQSLSPLPVRLDPPPRPPLGFHFSTFPPQISEHSFAIYGIAGLLLFHVSSVVNYLVSPVSPFSLVLHRVIDRFAVPSRPPLLLSLLRAPRRSLRFHVSTFPR